MERKKEWYVIGRGFNGWHAAGVNVSSSGGDLLPYEFHTGTKCAGYAAAAVDGALVYDAQHLEGNREAERAFIHLVVSGPMVNPALPPEGVDRFNQKDRAVAAGMLPGLEGGFRALAAAAQDEQFGGLDQVGVAVFERLLRRVPGIRIGHVRAGRVEWEEGK